MKPEMITPLAIPEQDYPKLALYIVDTNWAVDGESGSYEVVFTLHQDALRQFHNDLLEERNSGSIEQWREHSEFAEEVSGFDGGGEETIACPIRHRRIRHAPP